MLHKIRKTANTTWFKIFLIIIAIAFAWGYRDYMQFGGNKILVKFDKLDPIIYESFHKARSIEIQRLQHSSNTALTNEQIESMNLSAYVLQRMIRSKLIEYLAYRFDLDFGDAKVASVIRSYPVFKDDNGIYSPDRLKSYLQMNKIGVKEFSAENKNNIARDIIFSAFVGNAYIPKAKIDNIINFVTEKRSVDIATLDLSAARPNVKKIFEDKELKEFYAENKEMFKTPWKRDICYILADESASGVNIQVAEEEVTKFYKDNKDEFSGKKLASVKSEIKEYIAKEKFDKWISSLSKSLDDEVAGGSSLKEISDKYKLPVKCERNLNAANIESRGSGIFGLFLGELSNMNEGEVSYPADVDDRGIIIFEMKKYIAETLPEYDSIKNKVVSGYRGFLTQQANLKLLQDIKQKTSAQNFVSAISAQNIKVDLGKRFVRAKATEYRNIPENMLHSIFVANKNEIIGPFIEGGKAYLYIVKSIGRDAELKGEISKDKTNLLNVIRDNLAEELLIFAQNDANMQVRTSIDKIMLPKSGEE